MELAEKRTIFKLRQESAIADCGHRLQTEPKASTCTPRTVKEHFLSQTSLH